MCCICAQCKEDKPQDQFYFRNNRNKFRAECKQCTKENEKLRYSNNREQRINQMKQYNTINREQHLEYSREYYQEHKDSVLQRNKEWRSNFHDRYDTSYNNYRYHMDINHKIKCIIRNRLADALKSKNIELRHVDVGCSAEDLKKHIESQFKSGMSWDNWGIYGWHIDHIEPLANFDLSNEEEYKKACHYTNLQPLWAEENWYKNRDTNKRS